MTQKTSPFIDGKYGWELGESGWNLGMDENLLKFSFLFDRNVDAIVSSLPAAVNGKAYFLTTDNHLYFAVGTGYYNSPVPKHFEFTIRETGAIWMFDGASLVSIQTNGEIDSRLDAVETTITSLGTAAYEDVVDLVTQTQQTANNVVLQDYTDSQVATATSLANSAITNTNINTTKITSINKNIFRFADAVAVAGDYTVSLQAILDSAIAVNGAIVDITGDYSVSRLTVIGAAGIKFTGRGSIAANSASAQTELLLMSNCTTIDADCTWFINVGYRTNYDCAIRCDTKASGQAFAGVQIDGTITPIGAKVGFIFGNPSRPDDLVSEISWKTGKTYGCMSVIQAWGAQTVVNFSDSQIATLFGAGDAGWQALPQLTVATHGATINIGGGELIKTESGLGALTSCSAINTASGVQYGMINVTGTIVETAARLGITDNSISASSAGGFQFTGCHGVFTGGSPAGAAADVFETDGLFNGVAICRACNFFASPARTTLPLAFSNGLVDLDILSSFKLGFTSTLKNLMGGTGGIRRFKDEVILDARNLNGQVFSGGGSSVAKFQTVASVGLSSSYSAATGIFTVPSGGLKVLRVSCQIIGSAGVGEWYIQSAGTSVGVRKLGVFSSNECTLYDLTAGTQIQVMVVNGGFTGGNNPVTDYLIMTGSN